MLEIEGKNKMALKKFLKGVAEDVKKGLKGSKEYQEGKAKRKASRAAKKVAKQKAKNVKKISKMAVKAEKKEKGAGLKSVSIGKKSKPSKLSPTGKLRRGMKGVEVTEGGAYAKYGKKSGAAKSFRKAFAEAKGKDFEWDGRKYSGKKAEEGGKVESYSEGGKVEASSGESNPFGWPSRDARNGGKK
jgi:hypothetical protein